MAQPRKSRSAAAREAAAEAASIDEAREAARSVAPRGGGRAGRAADPLTGELRRRDVLPLLVLHLINEGPSYGNQLMERISRMTEGVLSINPNTMYPLLRQLEARGLIVGRWEHPERRSRRYYSLTPEGHEEFLQLRRDVRVFLESTARSIDEIIREVYGK
jgi:DNA-binding PadR family transcriptional regulator